MDGILVRALQPSEWAILRDLRLESLVDSPAAFVSSAAAERDKPETEWRSRVAQSAVAFRGERPVGVAGWVWHDGEAPVAELVGMWVQPTERGGAAAVELLRFVQRAVLAGDRVRLELDVLPENARAVRFYERCGFEALGQHVDPRAGGALLRMHYVDRESPGALSPP
jgi:RimJ/RimL family protein N-acetyltransferase